MWAIGHPAELFGQAVQVYNPDLDPNLLPAYEPGTPVSVTLMFANLWDTPMSNVVISETIASGFVVDMGSITPPDMGGNPSVTVLSGTTGTQVIWRFDSVSPGEVALGFVARTGDEMLNQGTLTFATGQATFMHEGREHQVRHTPFTLASRMAARLVADRDIEADRQYVIPSDGIYLNADLSLENKEDTLASQVIVTDVVLLIAPIVNIDDQETILDQNNGETIWVRNEPFFYNEPDDPYIPADGYAPGDYLTLADWDGQYAVFDVPFGTHGEVLSPTLQGTGNYVTIPATYTNYISLTKDDKLLLPVKVLTWTLNDWPGYHYEEPAIRYGIHSSELFSRTVTFAGDPGIAPDQVVIQGTAGSVYTNLGDYPIFYRDHVTSGQVYVPQSPVTPTITYQDIWARPHTTTLRSAFYDIFSWASCQCGPIPVDRHAGLNVTFGMKADTNADGERNEDVLLYPGRLDGANLDIVIKSRNMGDSIPSDQMVIDMGMFKGLGIIIAPRSGDWESSWHSDTPGTQLVEVQKTAGYDHLYFQHGIAPNETEEIVLEATISSFKGRIAEGMLKLHDGARLTYRQQAAGPSRYEVYDTHVQGVLGAGAEITVRKQGTPVLVNTYGDTLYYVITLDDPSDPRVLRRNGSGDPFLQSYGYTDLVATTYVGGRDQRNVLHSIVQPGEQTRIRVEINNNTGVEFTNVVVTPQPGAGITVTKSYTNTVPPSIYYDLPFMYAETIPDAGRGVYYFDVDVSPDYSGPRGQMVEIPLLFSGDGAPAEFAIPPARLGIADAGGNVYYVSSPATSLQLKDYLPPEVQMLDAVVATASDVNALSNATTTDQRAEVFDAFAAANHITFTAKPDGEVLFGVSGTALSRIYDPSGDHRLFVIAKGEMYPTQAGPTFANYGAQATFHDEFGMQWQVNSDPLLVEVHGAAVEATYECTEVTTSTVMLAEGSDVIGCILSSGSLNRVSLKAYISNRGDYPAQDVTAELAIPIGIDIVEASSNASVSSDNIVTWQVGDLAPGGWVEVSLVLSLHLNEDGTIDWYGPDMARTTAQNVSLADTQKTIEVINHSDGRFVETFSQQLIESRVGDALNLPVHIVGSDTDDGTDDGDDGTDDGDDGTDDGTDDSTGTPVLRLSYECAGVGGTSSSSCKLEDRTTNQVSLKIIMSNIGDGMAQAMRVSMTLAPGVTLINASPAYTIDGQTITWNVGNLEPGAQLIINLTVAVPVNLEGGVVSPSLAGSIEIIQSSSVTYTDPTTNELVTVPLGGSYYLPMLVDGVALHHTLSCTGVTHGTTSDDSACVLYAGQQNEVALDMVVSNTGSDAAEQLVVTLPIVAGIGGVDTSTSQATFSDQRVTWVIGTLNPGEETTLHLTLSVPINVDGGITLDDSQQSLTTVQNGAATYMDALSEKQVVQVLDTSSTLPVKHTEPQAIETTTVYLPTIVFGAGQNAVQQESPDLVVTKFTVSPASPITGQTASLVVEIENQGAATTQGFWVDLYINPATVPTAAGVRWDAVCGQTPCRGIAWDVPALEKGERVTLTSDVSSYSADYTVWTGGFDVSGVQNLYVYVDSWSDGQAEGAVTEADETNNRAEILGLMVGGTTQLSNQESGVLSLPERTQPSQQP